MSLRSIFRKVTLVMGLSVVGVSTTFAYVGPNQAEAASCESFTPNQVQDMQQEAATTATKAGFASFVTAKWPAVSLPNAALGLLAGLQASEWNDYVQNGWGMKVCVSESDNLSQYPNNLQDVDRTPIF